MVNRKILMSGFSIVSALALMGGSAFAYFTSQAQATDNTFSAGTLSVNLLDQNQNSAFTTEALASNWMPGDETLINFDVRNTGTIPANFSGFATGSWGVPELDAENAVKVTKVERWNGSAWETLLNESNGITGVFYYTSNGTNTGTAFDVAPGDRAQLQLTVKFDENANDDFQSKVFTSNITVNAKQVNAPW